MSRAKNLSNKVVINGKPVYFDSHADAKEARENTAGEVSGGRTQGPTINVVVVAAADHSVVYGEALFATGFWATHTETDKEIYPGFPRLMQVTPMESGSSYWQEGQIVAGLAGETIQLLAGVPQVIEMHLEGWSPVRYISNTFQRVTGLPVSWAATNQHAWVEDAGAENSFVIPGTWLDTSDEAKDEYNEWADTTALSFTDMIWLKCPYALPAATAAPIGTTPAGGGAP